MSLSLSSKNTTINQVVHECAIYLYSGKKDIVTFGITTGNVLRCNNDKHIFETKERRYGNALIITTFCLVCSSCYGEVIPPRQKGDSQ
ncbi:MAG: hypothetical protein ISR79_02630 [Nitrosopumilus sp.]|nr:hypothetical protein [Nitrosopumilus sp.]